MITEEPTDPTPSDVAINDVNNTVSGTVPLTVAERVAPQSETESGATAALTPYITSNVAAPSCNLGGIEGSADAPDITELALQAAFGTGLEDNADITTALENEDPFSAPTLPYIS